MQYRADSKRDLRQIANALGVANVLEGMVRREGNHVRVSTELIDARDDKTIWADSYDRDLNDIFAIQSEVAQTIAGKLAATLSAEEKKRIEAKPTDSLEAYDLYLRAKELTADAKVYMGIDISEKKLRDAISFLEQAVQIDPKFALAYCASTEAQDLLYLNYDRTLKRRSLADAAIASAQRLQPDLPEVHLANARHLYDAYRDYEHARAELVIARRGLTNNAEAILLEGYMDGRQGDVQTAIQRFNEVTTWDPGNSVAIAMLANALCAVRQYDDSEKVFDRLIALLPNRPAIRVQKAFVAFAKTGDSTVMHSAIAALPPLARDQPGVLSYWLAQAVTDRNWQQAKELIERLNGEENGDFAYGGRPVPAACYSIEIARVQGEQPDQNHSLLEARERLNQMVQRSFEDAGLLSQLAVADALLNQKETAIAEGTRAVEMLPMSKDVVTRTGTLVNLAVVYAWANQPDLAFEILARMVKAPGLLCYGLLKSDPLWDPLRQDPRFEKLLAELAPED
jgi:tetratricopeptide (TPR) repeat protein